MSIFTNHKYLILVLSLLCINSVVAQNLPSFTFQDDLSSKKQQFLPAVPAWEADYAMPTADVFSEGFDLKTSEWEIHGSDWQITNGHAEAGQYHNNSTSYLISPKIKIPKGQFKLKYSEKYALESYKDFGSVWISTSEKGWRKVHTITGVTDWRDTYIDLRAYQNQEIQLAFMLKTDETVNGEGWQIDALDIVKVQREFVKKSAQARTNAAAISLVHEGPLHAALTSRETNTFPSISANIRVEGVPDLLESNFTAFENNEEQTEDFNVVLPQGGTFRPADIVFLIDNSASMSPYQMAIQNSVNDFVNDLFDAGVDAALGLTRFGQSGGGLPIVEENGTLFTDPDVFLNSIFSRNADNGSYEPGLNAMLASVSEFNFRPNAQKIFILITNEDNDGFTEPEDVLPILQQQTITLYSVINVTSSIAGTSQTDYGDLAINSGGQQFDIDDLGNSETLATVIDSIEEGIATDDTYIVSYTSSNPTLDGLERIVDIVVALEGETDTVTFTYTPGAAPAVSLLNSTLSLIQNAQPEGIPLTIQANITDFEEPFVQSATLLYKNTGSNSYTSVPMSNAGGDLWEAIIPANIAVMPGVDFYITATDGVTTTSDRPDSPAQNPYQIAINPNVAPVISSTPITSLNMEEDLNVSANISDNTNEVSSASLFYRGIGEPLYQEVTMTNTGGDSYEVTVDASMLSQNGVQYYIKATDNFGISTYFGEPQNPIEVEILTGNQTTLILSPSTIQVDVNQEVCVTAEYSDQNGDPISNEEISFEVNGVNEASVIVETDENGIAEFCYTPTSIGEDILTASAGGFSDNTVITIQPGNGSTQLEITAFNLIDAETNVMIQSISDGEQIMLSSLSADMFSIEAITNPLQVGSVSFDLKGLFTHTQIESKAPYAIFGDSPQGNFNGRLLPPGNYTLTATPYSDASAQGAAGSPLEVSFTIVGEEVPADLQITDFDLYDAVTDKKLIDLQEGSVINLQLLENDELTILINSMPDFIGSVMLELSGPISSTRVENTKPYAVFRNNSTELFGETFVAGNYTMSAIPYTEKNAQGIAGAPMEINFSIIDEEPDLLITDFDLYDAVTDQKILDIAEGSEIALNELENTYLTLLINVMPDFVGSVQLELSGPVNSTRIENTSPYAVFRNEDNDFFGANFVPGNYTMTATPYTEKNAQGMAGASLVVNFSMVDESSLVARKGSNLEKEIISESLEDVVITQENHFIAYPIPFYDQFFIKTDAKANNLNVTLYGLDGKSYPISIQQIQNNLQINLKEQMSSGLYMLTISADNQPPKAMKIYKK